MIRVEKKNLVSRYAFSLKPNFLKVYFDICFGFLMLIMGFLFSLKLVFIENIFFIFPSIILLSFWFGLWIHYLSEFLHEAAHHNIAPSKKFNDFLANFLIGSWIGFTVQTYRSGHFAHHKYLGTTKDPENSYFNKLNIRFIFESLLLIKTFKYFKAKLINKEFKDTANDAKNAYSINSSELILSLIFQAFIIYSIGDISLYALSSWLIGFYIFFPFIGSIRQLLEHRHPYAEKTFDSYLLEDHGECTRNFGDNIFAKIIGGAGFNRHFYHHLFPSVSYTKLGDLEHFCKTQRVFTYSIKKDSYKKVFLKLLKI